MRQGDKLPPLMPIVECVPNFSEGRRADVVDAIARAATSVSGVVLLDREMDADHNRSVLTFAGEAEAVLEAAFRAAREAAARIDLNLHKGEHPRMGATDVIPFIPLPGAMLADCVGLAERLAERIARELAIPTYLYAAAARRPERTSLPNVRKGEFEGLRSAIAADPERAPDFGLKKIHPTAGATAVGARDFLIAFNVNLDAADLELAKSIAGELRESSGGLPTVQAKGFLVDDGKTAQVSMNLLDYQKVSPGRAVQEVEERARRRGRQVKETEIIGLIPREALLRSAVDLLHPRNWQPDQVLEARLAKAGLKEGGEGLLDFLEALASPDPAPGGGSAAALGGAVGAALACMVLSLTAAKAEPEVSARMKEIASHARGKMRVFHALMDRDARAYGAVVEALALPKSSAVEKEARSDRLKQAMIGAIEVPLETMREGVATLGCLKDAAAWGSPHALSDVGVGVLAARLCITGAAYNVEINLKSMKDVARAAEYRARMEALAARARSIEGEIDGILQARTSIPSLRSR